MFYSTGAAYTYQNSCSMKFPYPFELHLKYIDKVILKFIYELLAEFLAEKKARIWRVNNWGMRRLAYQIKNAKNAYYVLMNFEMEAKWINDFKTMLDKDERVIRHLVIKRDEAITEDCPPPPEFHTLGGGTDSDEEEEDDMEYDDEEYEDDDEDGIIIVDADNDDNIEGDREQRRVEQLV